MWGVPYVSKKTKERSEHLVEHLLTSDYDVVGLQEIFVSWHATLIQEGARSVFEHSHWFRSGVLGSPGLLVLSRYPIVDVAFQPFTLNGYPQCVFHGDWWAGKGVGMCRIDHPLAIIDFYITHLHAGYGTGSEYTEYKVSQMYSMAKFVGLSSRSDAVVVVGDFNCTEDEVATQLFVEMSGLTDSYRELYPDIEAAPGWTNDTPECSWRPVSKTAHLCSSGDTKRIDYVFYNDNKLKCVQCEVTLGNIPGKSFSYSDHMGVESIFELSENPSTAVNLRRPTKNTAESTLAYLDEGLQGSYADAKQKLVFWLVSVLLWCIVIAVAAFEFIPSVAVGVVASLFATSSTGLFLYLMTFSKFQIAKFSEIKNEVTILTKTNEVTILT